MQKIRLPLLLAPALSLVLSSCIFSNPFESNEERVRLRRSDNSYNCLTFALSNQHVDENNPGFNKAANPAQDFLVCCISVQYGCGGL